MIGRSSCIRAARAYLHEFLGNVHLLPKGGDGSKNGGSTKNIEGREGGVRKNLDLMRGVYENNINGVRGGSMKIKLMEPEMQVYN